MKLFLRILYKPYEWFVFIPLLAVLTTFFGSLAVILCMVMPPRIPSFLCGTVWAKLNAWFTPMFVRVVGKHNIDKNQSYVIVSNHQSQYDIFVLYGWLGIDFKWVMKKELRKVPFIGASCEKLGHVFIDRSNRKAAIASIREAKEKIINGTSIVFFPEGTRSRTSEMLPFKKGAFRMALDLGLPILPVTIRGTREILPPGTSDLFPGKADLIIHRPVSLEPYDDKTLKELMQKIRAVIQSAL